jgi:Xaa-Pro aminopeptidase
MSVTTPPRSEPIARANGCAVVRSYTGHGINSLFHTAPNVPHYAKNKAVGTMKPGMVTSALPHLSLFLTQSFYFDHILPIGVYDRTGELNAEIPARAC